MSGSSSHCFSSIKPTTNKLKSRDMTNDLNNNDLEKPPELMLEFKIKKDGPYEFALDVIDNKLFVIDILPGGIIHRHGGLLIDDELVELNGAKFDAENFYECIHMLETALEDKTSIYLELKVSRKSRVINENVSEPEEEITSL